MDVQDIKCVMVIDGTLPLGMIANSAAVMGATLGKLFPDAIGPDVYDADANPHLGIVAIPIPTLRGDPALLSQLRKKLYQPEYEQLTVVDFSDAAQSCHTYDVFTEKIAGIAEVDLRYFGIGICGSKKLVNRLTGSLPLLR